MILQDIKFTITEVEHRVYHVEFETQRDLAHTMMRLQEYYEGVDDNIRGNYFTLEEFYHHFTNEDGHFEYTKIWSGFNVPGHIVTEWFDLFSNRDRLTFKERQLFIELFQHVNDTSKRWYLIATASTSTKHVDVVKHEVAHARYYLSNEYRNECDKLVEEIDATEREAMRSNLMQMGYTTHVIKDEIQAYLSTSKKPELRLFFGKLSPATMSLVEKFRTHFKSKKIIYEAD